jgi:hypothetical protein
MIGALIAILIILWFLGYIHINGLSIPDINLFTINGRFITLWDLLILLVVSWALSILPTPFRAIAGVLLILWVLSVLGILSIAGFSLSGLLVIAIIIGIIFSIL